MEARTTIKTATQEMQFRRTNTDVLLFQFQDEPPPHWNTVAQRHGATHVAIIDKLAWVKFATWKQAYDYWTLYSAPPQSVHTPIAAPAHSGHQNLLTEINAMATRLRIAPESVKTFDMTLN